MNVTTKLAMASLVFMLAACGKPTQADVDKAAQDRAAGIAKADQNAQPAIDAANRDLAKTQQQGAAKVAEARTDASRETGKAALRQTKEQAKADYDVAIAKADGDLAVALVDCGMRTAEAKSACEQSAHSAHDLSVSAAKAQLDSIEKQASL